MKAPNEALSRGLTLWRELVEARAPLAAELAQSRSLFGAHGDPGADQRHLEWFVLERPSESLGGVPVEALHGEWLERAGAGAGALGEAFLGSVAGAYEVRRVAAGHGLLVADLIGLAEFEVHEPEATGEMQVGDLVVGRLFPLEGGVHRLSPAAACFRNPDLVASLRADLERMRSGHAGPLRIRQLELERLFFPAHAAAEPERRPADAVLDAREQLLAAGLSGPECDRVLRQVTEQAAASPTPGGNVVTEILNRLAFETSADLGPAREALVQLWGLLRTQPSRRDGSVTLDGGDGADADNDVRAALEAFDRGRAEGRDLEELFQTLEQDLELDADDDEGEDATSPDFPGVVGAMVDEFLWDVAREEGDRAARPLKVLRSLSDYGSGIGVFEELGARELTDFAARWLLDEERLADADEASALLDALEHFCRWTQERHHHPLLNAFGPTLAGLRRSLPRVVQLRGALRRVEESSVFEVLGRRDDQLRLRDDGGREREVLLPSTQAAHLDTGDWIHGALDAAGTLQLSACYPPEVVGLMTRRR